MEYHSALKKEQMWISWTETDEARACYIEWSSQKEKNKYCTLRHIYIESRKMVLMNLFTGKEGKCRRRKGNADITGEGEGGTNEKVELTYIDFVVAKLYLTLCDLMDCVCRLFCPRDSPGKNTGVGCHFLLRGIFLIQWSNLWLLHWQADSLPLSHQGNPYICYHG